MYSPQLIDWSEGWLSSDLGKDLLSGYGEEFQSLLKTDFDLLPVGASHPHPGLNSVVIFITLEFRIKMDMLRNPDFQSYKCSECDGIVIDRHHCD